MPKAGTTSGGLKRPREFGRAMYSNGGLGNIGYPGLTNTAFMISEYFPKSKIYVEPFCGLARTARYAKCEKMVLNDMSDYALNECRKKYPNAIITKSDFVECILKWDGPDTFFLIDPPWCGGIYSQNEKCYYDRKVIEYYDKLLEMVPILKGNWFILSNYYEKENRKALENSGYHLKIFTSKRTLMGGKIRTKAISNKPFTRHNQNTLTSYISILL